MPEPYTGPPAWENRWLVPSPQTLLEALHSPHREVFLHMHEQLAAESGVHCSTVWYGPSWKWTIRFDVPAASGQREALCYIVPNTAAPKICVAWSDRVMGDLPIKRLNKFVRDGLETAKCAVQMHWAIWIPGNQSDAGHLLELFRKVGVMSARPASESEAA